MNLDKELEAIVNKVSNKNLVKPKDLVHALEQLYKDMYSKMSSNDKVDVMIHNFGTFELDSRNVNRALFNTEAALLETPDDPNLLERKEYLEKIKEKVNKNKHTRNDNRSKQSKKRR